MMNILIIYFHSYLILLNAFKGIISPLTSVVASASPKFWHVLLSIFRSTYFVNSNYSFLNSNFKIEDEKWKACRSQRTIWILKFSWADVVRSSNCRIYWLVPTLFLQNGTWVLHSCQLLTPPLGCTSFSITLLGRVCRVRIWECTLLDSQGDFRACSFPLWSWRPYVILHLNYFNILDSVGIVFASTRIFQRLINSFGKSHIHNPFWDRTLYLISGNLDIFTCVYNKAFNLSKVISVQKNGLLGTI